MNWGGEYLRTRATDDVLLRDYPYESVLSLIQGLEVRMKFCGIDPAGSRWIARESSARVY
jgi:hypothetical protein